MQKSLSAPWRSLSGRATSLHNPCVKQAASQASSVEAGAAAPQELAWVYTLCKALHTWKTYKIHEKGTRAHHVHIRHTPRPFQLY